MAGKTKYGKREVKVMDAETGEVLELAPAVSYTVSDRNFHKIFIENFIKTLKGVAGKQMQVVLWIIKVMSPRNEVKYTYNEIAEGSKVSLQTVVRTVEALEKDNFLCRDGEWFLVNPDAVFRGRFESRNQIISRYKQARELSMSGIPDGKERAALRGQLEDTEKELEKKLEQVKYLEIKKREIEKKLAPKRKPGPKPKKEKREGEEEES